MYFLVFTITWGIILSFPKAIPLLRVGRVRVTHPCATRQQDRSPLLPFDLHVLSLPLAFILSQDQTLHSINSYEFFYLRIQSCSVSSFKLYRNYFYKCCQIENSSLNFYLFFFSTVSMNFFSSKQRPILPFYYSIVNFEILPIPRISLALQLLFLILYRINLLYLKKDCKCITFIFFNQGLKPIFFPFFSFFFLH